MAEQLHLAWEKSAMLAGANYTSRPIAEML